MHARDLVELAAIAVDLADSLILGTTEIRREGLEIYWSASKCRLDRWGRSLKAIATPHADIVPASDTSQSFSVGVLEEVLSGEVLTRTWAALLAAYSRLRGDPDAVVLARSIFIGHMEARHRTLKILVRGPGVTSEQALALNRLRQHAERWTDLLVGRLLSVADVSEFGFDARRAHDYGRGISSNHGAYRSQQAWPGMLAALRAGCCQVTSAHSPNADLNTEIGAAVLATFPGELFDSTGLPRSQRLQRIARATDDTLALLDNLFSAGDSNLRADDAPPCLPTNRVRRFPSG